MTHTIVPRRAFLQLLAIAAAACSSDPSPPPAGAAGAGGGGAAGAGAGGGGAAGGGAGAPSGTKQGLALLWDIADELQRALRQSPDHLPAEAARLVAAKDAKSIFALVRDRITTVPIVVGRTVPGYAAAYGDDARLLFGPRATLRAGAGSARDKVELLRELLVQAGLNAKVVQTDYRPLAAEVLAHFGRKATPALAITLDAAKLDGWLTQLGLSQADLDATPSARIEPTDADAIALADQLASLLPALDDLAPTDPEWEGDSPAVQVTINGQVRVLQPLRPDAAFDQAYGTVLGEAAAATAEDVVASVEAVWSDDFSWTPMVTGTWPASEVAGRQISFTPLPLVAPTAYLQGTLRDTTTFRPALVLQAVEDENEPFRVEQSFVGDGFSLGGDVITVDADDRVAINGRPLATKGEKGPVEQVDSLTATATALGFPRVEIRVSARDKANQPVGGLGGAAFELREEGTVRSALLRANSAARRALVLIDGSLSMPPEYLDAGGTALLAEIRAGIAAIDPTFEVAADFTESNLWTALANATSGDADAIVFVTDGDVTDEKTAAILAALAAVPKVLLLDVSPELDADVVEMATLTGGVAQLVASPAEARDKAVAFLATTPPTTYVLSYDADAEGPTERNVSVRVGQAEGTTSYRLPALEERLPPRRLIGLRLALTIGGETFRRPIAGYGVERTDEPTGAAIDELQAAVSLALRGPLVVTFDGEAPLPAVHADQLLRSFRGVRVIAEAIAQPTASVDSLIAAIRQHRVLLPRSYSPMGARTPDSLAASIATGSVGATIHGSKVKVTGGEGRIRRYTDVVSIARHRAVGAGSPTEAFRANLRASVFRALLEAATFSTNTVSELANKTLTLVAPYGAYELPATMAEPKRAQLEHLLGTTSTSYRVFASDGSSAALWVIDPKTGEAFALLGDGSGGSAEDEAKAIEAATKNYARVLDLISIFAEIFQAGNVGFAAGFAAFQLAMWSAATISVAGLDGSGAPAELIGALEGQVVGAIGTLAGGMFGSIFSILYTVYGAIEREL